MSRWYVRCADCLTVSAVDSDKHPVKALCGICGGSIETMGRVYRDHLQTGTHEECKCDDRCVSALGPNCNCQCGGKNHGAGMLGYYTVTETASLPTLTRSGNHETRKAQAEQYRAAIAAATATVEALSHGWGHMSTEQYRKLNSTRSRIWKAQKARTHAARMKALGIDPKAPVQAAQTALSL